MTRVTGIGGVFFKARDRQRLSVWYRDHLGIELDAHGGTSFSWRDRDDPEWVGRTVFGPFDADTDYLAPSTSPFMINFRVENLDAAIADLKQDGIKLVGEVEDYDYGRFAWIMDPEGNKIELWEPRGEEGQK